MLHLLRPRDDRLDDRLAIFALALAGRIESGRRVIEGEAMRDERLQVDLARGNETDRERVVSRLETRVSDERQVQPENAPRNGKSP